MLKRLLLCTILILSFQCLSQTHIIDSLELKLTTSTGQQEIKILYALGAQYVDFDSLKARQYVKQGIFLATKNDYQNLIITKGAAGADYDGVNYPTEKTKIVDVVGAGDTFLAALVYFHLLYSTLLYVIITIFYHDTAKQT